MGTGCRAAACVTSWPQKLLFCSFLFADKCVAGYSLVAFRKGSFRARLYSVALDPAKQGRGLGRFLLGASEQAASARGALVMAS